MAQTPIEDTAVAKKTRRRRKRGTRKAVPTHVSQNSAGKGGGGRPSALSQVSLKDLHNELQRRQQLFQTLSERRQSLAAQLARAEAELAQFEVVRGAGRPRKNAARRGAGRPRIATKTRTKKAGGAKTSQRQGGGEGGMTLVDALQKVLQGKTLGRAEMATAVKNAGYKSKSANLRNIISQTITANKNRFTKVARGQFTAK